MSIFSYEFQHKAQNSIRAGISPGSHYWLRKLNNGLSFQSFIYSSMMAILKETILKEVWTKWIKTFPPLEKFLSVLVRYFGVRCLEVCHMHVVSVLTFACTNLSTTKNYMMVVFLHVIYERPGV